jgi:hypothetical protein
MEKGLLITIFASGELLAGTDDIHALSELAYHTSQNKALQWLQAYPSSWANHDVWLLMGPFHNCPMRQRIGTSGDGGASSHVRSDSCCMCTIHLWQPPLRNP